MNMNVSNKLITYIRQWWIQDLIFFLRGEASAMLTPPPGSDTDIPIAVITIDNV